MKLYSQILPYKTAINNKYPNTQTQTRCRVVWNFLIAICKAAHTGHDTEHVVVGGVHTDGGGGVGAHGVGRDGEQQRGVVNTRQVARA